MRTEPVRARTYSTPSRPLAMGARARAADRAWIVMVAVVANAVVVVGLWIRHGGIANATGPGATATAIGQLTGLLGAYAVLLELLLMARVPWLERFAGLDHLAVWHRWNGFTAVWLLIAHTVFITIGYAAGNHQSLVGQTLDFVDHYPDVLMAFVSLVIFIGVAATSMRMARRELQRETWYLVHLYAYLAVALGFAHQLAVGNDFSNDAVARAWWSLLYAVVVGSILVWRVGSPLAFNARHRLRVDRVEREAPDVVSIYVTGRDVDRIRAVPGQFFMWRFLTPTGWWKAHPFSLSAAPTRNRLRITVKDLGDDTAVMQRVRRGTGVFAEGPYGTFTADRRTRRKVLLIAGGIGITPLRALLDTLPGRPGDVTLLYRVVDTDDAVFRDELKDLARERGIEYRLGIGAEIGDDRTDKLGIPAIRAMVPDVRDRDCFVCGPPGLIDAVCRRLRLMGVPKSQIHYERFEF
ncbi:MAG: ferric reductase-like transmembrane domain-containing protein [Actinobacteria bacterium]|nr:ferric reductase-like transmembrane domain-containing protein [Actinomycetota bacterium]